MQTTLFPGQGSQVRGMGAHLFPLFPELTAQADAILGYSIQSLCLEDKQQQLNQTQYTQPALYVVNALSYLHKIQETGKLPDYVAGHSLGEYSALFAAKVMDFATGLKLVKKRGELMSQAQQGGMAAVVGLTAAQIVEILQQHDLALTIANYNTYLQSVLSGSQKDIARAQTIFQQQPATTFIPLKVSGAFHSPAMLPAQQAFATFLSDMTFSTSALPVIANVDAQPYHPAVVQTNLATQISSSVQWVKTIEYLLQQGDMEFHEIGPGQVLSGLVHKIKSKG